MAEKGFGVKEIDFIGSSPKITSPSNLNLNAVNVAISTNVSIGGTLSVTGNVSVGGTLTYEDVTNIDSVGLITARNGLIVTGVTTTGGITIKAPTSTSVMVGQEAGLNHSGAAQCVGVGFYALRDNTNSNFNTAVGTQALGALGSNTGSSYSSNTAVGHLAGYTMTTGSTNTLIGANAGSTINSSANTILGKYDGNQGGLDIRSSSGNIVLADGNSNVRLYINSSGNVGINQLSPASKLDVVGDIKATTFTGSGANLTNLPVAYSDIQVAYELINTSSSGNGWRINGNGIVNTTSNPDLYLIRGQKYRFINNSGGSHPFQIQSDPSGSGTPYTTGVTNNSATSGNIDFVPRNDAPSHLYYDCTNHGGMLGNIYLRGASGNETNVGVTTFTGAVRQTGNPVFMVYRTSNYSTSTSASVLVFNEEKIDVGGNYDTSNGRFTAPVTGLYEFAYASIASNTQTVYRYDLRINGSIPYSGLRQELRIDQSNVTQYGTNGEYCLYINMTAGQYAQVYVTSDTNVSSVYGDTSYGYTYFRGRLIG